jgi:hypothetical protein
MKATELANAVKGLGNVTTNEAALDFVRELTVAKQPSPALGVTIVIDADSGKQLAYAAHPFGVSNPVTLLEMEQLKASVENFITAQLIPGIDYIKEQAIREQVKKELTAQGGDAE